MYKSGGGGGLWGELVFLSVEKVCCEASDLHSVVRRINVEPFPFDVCEQLFLSNCKMQLIIVYSDTNKMLCSSIFEHETATSMTTILKHYVVPVTHKHTHTSGWFLEENPREYFTFDLQGSLILSSKMYAGVSKQICIQMIFPCALNIAVMWDHSTSGGTAAPFLFD